MPGGPKVLNPAPGAYFPSLPVRSTDYSLFITWFLPDIDWLNTPDVADQAWIEQGGMENMQCWGPRGPRLRTTAGGLNHTSAPHTF